jgi:cytidine deaminase
MTPDSLVEAARLARERAFAPYSGFRVGAALEAADGRIVAGCNVESASYGLTLCAERVALVKAISDGITGFKRVAVVTDADDLTPPCGACRQLLWEFAPDAEVILANLRGNTAVYRVAELLPHGFDAANLRQPPPANPER